MINIMKYITSKTCITLAPRLRRLISHYKYIIVEPRYGTSSECQIAGLWYRSLHLAPGRFPSGTIKKNVICIFWHSTLKFFKNFEILHF